MKVFAISDLHLSGSQPKPMDIFGSHWQDYTMRIKTNWINGVSEDDVVIIAGDISWAMKLEDAKQDLDWISGLPGTKVMIRGNHDYWWNSITKIRSVSNGIVALQNDAYRLEDFVFCGCRGWLLPGNKDYTSSDAKIYQRELIRLKMGLDSAVRLMDDNSRLVVMLHYPPICTDGTVDANIESLLLQYKVKTVVFGHIHGKHGYNNLMNEINGISYYLTSCDMLNFCPIQIF